MPRRSAPLAALAFWLAACASTPSPEAPEASGASQRASKHGARRRPAPLPAADVAYALRGSESDFRECFGYAQRSVRGFVRLDWRVTPSGTVENVTVDRSSIDDETVEECLTRRLRELHFGRPERASAARWAFVFRLEDAEPLPSSNPPPKKKKSERKRHKRRTKSEREAELQAAEDAEPGLEVERSSPGWLEPDAIESVVGNGYRLFARCYRDGIARNPALGGAVRLRFVIEEDGTVPAVWNSGSDVPDQQVIDCVAEAFFAMQFPKPERGRVHVRYRLRMNSG